MILPSMVKDHREVDRNSDSGETERNISIRFQGVAKHKIANLKKKYCYKKKVISFNSKRKNEIILYNYKHVQYS